MYVRFNEEAIVLKECIDHVHVYLQALPINITFPAIVPVL
jgi:hypothetical protein